MDYSENQRESLVYLKYNAKEDYIKTPFSVLLYISELEDREASSRSTSALLGIVSLLLAVMVTVAVIYIAIQ